MAGRGRPRLGLGSHGEIRVTKEGDKFVARTRFRDMRGVVRQVRGSGASKAAAKRALMERLARWEQPESGVTMQALYEQWLPVVAASGIRPQTLRSYKSMWSKALAPVVADLACYELTPGMVMRVSAAVSVSHPGSHQSVMSVLRSVCSFGVRQGAFEFNPVNDLPRRRTERKQIRTLSDEDIRCLRRRAEDWHKGNPLRTMPILDIMDVLLSTGMRIGELLALTWEDDVSEDNSLVTVQATQVRLGGVGDIRQPFTKGSSVMVYPLTAHAQSVMARRREARGGQRFVFSTASGSMLCLSNVNGAWKKVRGDEYAWVTWHTFRKTVATRVSEAFGLEAASAMLGHAGVAVTQAHYVSRSPLVPDVRAVLEDLIKR